MPNERLIIRKETLPTRCDVCHQADMFDPETDTCARCAPVVSARADSARTSTERPTEETGDERFPKNLTFAGICLFLAIGLCSTGRGSGDAQLFGILLFILAFVSLVLALVRD